MAALERQSSFLPTIKCSLCGNQIEISMMGDHVCSGPAEEPPMPPPPEKEKLDTFMPFNKEVHEKIGRVPPPPKVDTLAANRTYYRAGQLTPVSNSSGTASRSASPLTPNARSLAGRSEDYFAPKIANEDDTTQQPQPRRPGGYGGMNEFDDQMYPADPTKKQAPNLLARMNSIAPGPFDTGRRPSASASSRNPPPRRPSEHDDGMGDMGNPYGERPTTSNTNASFGSGGNQPRAPRANGYGGFGPPQRGQDELEPEPLNSRSGTFPRESEPADSLLRTPSEPGSRSDRQRRPSNDGHGRLPLMGPDTSRPLPPRTSSNRPPTGDVNLAAANLADDFGIGNPYHSPNSSLSSNGSSRPSQPSSQTSPARSVRSRPTRKPSDTSSFDSLMQDLQSSMDDMASLGQSRDPPAPQGRTHERSGSLRNQASTRRQDSRNDSYSQRVPSPLPSPSWDNSMDRGNNGARGRDNRGPPSPRYSSPERMAERASSRAAPRGQSKGREPVPKSRGNCKACREPITGKSISSADGRLTGRYHKACFVCTTCRDPFTSATFYVHDDMPYCEQHYHEINGSLCGTCNIGIEGQYLADERDTKYHPPCFRCADCGQILSDGYFEIGGRRYCEKDAWRRTQPAPQPVSRAAPRSNLGPGHGARRPPPGGLPGGPKGFPGNRGMHGQQYGPPGGNNRLGPPGPRPRMEKRMTRLGMM